MSRILDELKDAVLSCSMEEKLPHRWVDNHEMVGGAIDMIDSLGENARRMLEIGIVQDRLVELGFKPFGDTYVIESMGRGYPSKGFAPKMNQSIIRIDFDLCYVTVSHNEKAVFSYTSPIWQDDLINKVKGLIECNN